ncbi:hypothetical protein [Trinickia sp. Y13]|uniref:hypothetical protein n=1 Tax=Trinickia sp. Y13 TaxID=2917807 RepID=UPI0032175AA8
MASIARSVSSTPGEGALAEDSGTPAAGAARGACTIWGLAVGRAGSAGAGEAGWPPGRVDVAGAADEADAIDDAGGGRRLASEATPAVPVGRCCACAIRVLAASAEASYVCGRTMGELAPRDALDVLDTVDAGRLWRAPWTESSAGNPLPVWALRLGVTGSNRLALAARAACWPVLAACPARAVAGGCQTVGRAYRPVDLGAMTLVVLMRTAVFAPRVARGSSSRTLAAARDAGPARRFNPKPKARSAQRSASRQRKPISQGSDANSNAGGAKKAPRPSARVAAASNACPSALPV